MGHLERKNRPLSWMAPTLFFYNLAETKTKVFRHRLEINNIKQIFFFKTCQIQPLLLGIISNPLNIISFFQISRVQQPADHF